MRSLMVGNADASAFLFEAFETGITGGAAVLF
jgi:hypothetical protein